VICVSFLSSRAYPFTYEFPWPPTWLSKTQRLRIASHPRNPAKTQNRQSCMHRHAMPWHAMSDQTFVRNSEDGVVVVSNIHKEMAWCPHKANKTNAAGNTRYWHSRGLHHGHSCVLWCLPKSLKIYTANCMIEFEQFIDKLCFAHRG